MFVMHGWTADYFERVANEAEPKAAANWCINELFGLLNKASLGIEPGCITPGQLAALLVLVKDGTLFGQARQGRLRGHVRER